MGLLRHQRAFVESGKDELELARIPIDVADGEHARHAGFKTFRLDGDEFVVAELDAPIRDRTKFHRQSEERQQRVAGDLERRAVIGLDHGLADLTAGALERRHLAENEIDFAFADQRHHFVDAVRRGAEFAAPVQQCEMTCDRSEVERPVERAVAAADDENTLVAQRLHLAHRVEDRFSLIRLDAWDRRALRLERAATGGDDEDLALELGALVGLHAEQGIADLLHRLHHFSEMELRIERLNLLQQRIDEALRAGVGNAGNVVNRLLRIEFGALPADLVENVDEVTLHVEQAKFENGEQPDGPRTNNDNVCFDRFSHNPVQARSAFLPMFGKGDCLA